MFDIFLVAVAVFMAYKIYVSLYFKSEKFRALKNSIEQYTKNCNDLNDHLEELKSTYSDISSPDYGHGTLSDNSNYNMKRKKWSDVTKNSRTHNCAATVVKNANAQPFKYLCKYFNVKTDEDTLSTFEEVLNNFSAAEQGKILLKNERDSIVKSIASSIPALIMGFEKERVIKELGFKHIDLSDLYFPVYTFQYVSAGGNSSSKCDIQLNIENLDKFVVYMNDLVKFRKSVAGQRALMTSSLREKIKQRDNFTCKICSLSANDAKNLLLEIDHVVPLSKGGITAEENLQTLCWKCNRTKGSKLLAA